MRQQSGHEPAIHGSVSHCYNPRPKSSILGFVGLFEVVLEPLILSGDLSPSILYIEVEFGGEADDVNGSDIEAVEVVIHITARLINHCETTVVVGEVAVGRQWLVVGVHNGH